MLTGLFIRGASPWILTRKGRDCRSCGEMAPTAAVDLTGSGLPGAEQSLLCSDYTGSDTFKFRRLHESTGVRFQPDFVAAQVRGAGRTRRRHPERPEAHWRALVRVG